MKALIVCDCHFYPKYKNNFTCILLLQLFKLLPVAYWLHKPKMFRISTWLVIRTSLHHHDSQRVLHYFALCQILYSHSPPQNLKTTAYNTTSDQRICRVNNIKQLNPYIHFISGKDNIVAIITISLDLIDESWLAITSLHLDLINGSVLSKGQQIYTLNDSVSERIYFANDPCLVDCFLHVPPTAVFDSTLLDYWSTFDVHH